MDAANAELAQARSVGASPQRHSAPDEPGVGPSSRPAVTPSDGDLSDREQAILAFERQWWKLAGAKEQAIRLQFGLSATRYYQVLNALIDRPEALAHDPMVVKRLRRLRAARQRARSARRLGFEA